MKWVHIAFLVAGVVLFFFICPPLVSASDDFAVMAGYFLMAIYFLSIYLYAEHMYTKYRSRANQTKENDHA